MNEPKGRICDGSFLQRDFFFYIVFFFFHFLGRGAKSMVPSTNLLNVNSVGKTILPVLDKGILGKESETDAWFYSKNTMIVLKED